MSETITYPPYQTPESLTRDWDQEFNDIVTKMRETDALELYTLIGDRMSEWMKQPEYTIPALIKSLSLSNQQRSVHGIDRVGWCILDRQAFVTRSEDGSKVEEGYMITTEISPDNSYLVHREGHQLTVDGQSILCHLM